MRPFEWLGAQIQPERLDFATMQKLPPEWLQNGTILPRLPGRYGLSCYRLP